MAPDAPRPAFDSVEIPGGQLWAAQVGNGPDVVLVSGLGDTHEIWDDLVPLLADHHRVTLFDNRGVGRSPRGTRPLSIGAFAQETVALMDALGVDRAHLVGSSMGGAIVQEIALAHTGRVASLALAGTWARPDEHLSRLLRHFSRLHELLDESECTEAISLWAYSGQAYADGTVDRLMEFMSRSTSPPQPPQVFAETAEAAIAHDAADRLGSVGCPTLVIVGGEDRICPLRLSNDLVELVPDSTLHVVRARGHQPFQEDAEEFMAALRVFWEVDEP
jgi:pimeloyl-ACP methyl ester carboxylesterase